MSDDFEAKHGITWWSPVTSVPASWEAVQPYLQGVADLPDGGVRILGLSVDFHGPWLIVPREEDEQAARDHFRACFEEDDPSALLHFRIGSMPKDKLEELPEFEGF